MVNGTFKKRCGDEVFIEGVLVKVRVGGRVGKVEYIGGRRDDRLGW